MTPAEILEAVFKFGSLGGAAAALAYYGGQWTRSVRSIDETVKEMRDDIKAMSVTQQSHAERLAGIEARQAAHR